MLLLGTFNLMVLHIRKVFAVRLPRKDFMMCIILLKELFNIYTSFNLSTHFQTFLDCSARPSDVVPIIVGCALAGTVLLVLVAYLVGRRRNRAAGYQSV